MANPADSTIYGPLFGDAETAALFSDAAELAALLQVETALARAQAALGIIPADAADAIAAELARRTVGPADLAAGTARNGVPIPALLAALRAAAARPEDLHHLHHGATSQDIVDTALALRLRALLDLWDRRLAALLGRLAALASAHADLPMAARTYGQHATPTTFGALVAAWGWPLLGWRDDLAALRPRLLVLSLSGAAGTLAAMGPQGPALRARLAADLGLADPGHGWHTDRSGIARLGSLAAGLAGSLGKMAGDILALAQSDIAEITLGTGGASSAMPQKTNPVLPSVLVALSHQVIGLSTTLHASARQQLQRDGAAWFTEWLTLPPLCIAAGRMLSLADDILATLAPDPAAMARPLTTAPGLIHAETLVMALAAHMPLPDAQAAIRALCDQARDGGTDLPALAAARFPAETAALVLPDTGQAPHEARAFAHRATGQHDA